jgi:hypothetical protein
VSRACDSEPEALLLAVDAKVLLTALRVARRTAGCARSTFASLSESGVTLIGQPEAAGLLISQVLPYPERRSHPLVAAYQQALARVGGVSSYASLEGYLYGRVLSEVLRRCGRHASAACVQKTMLNSPPEIPGWKLRFTRCTLRRNDFAGSPGTAGALAQC